MPRKRGIARRKRKRLRGRKEEKHYLRFEKKRGK